jgi:hypothetical protein
MASERKKGFTLKTWYVQDNRAGHIQGGHKSAEDAIRHANAFPGKMTAYESVTNRPAPDLRQRAGEAMSSSRNDLKPHPEKTLAWVVWEYGLRPGTWWPRGETISRVRHVSVALYNAANANHDYDVDKRNGWVICRRTLLDPTTPTKAKSKHRSKP